MITRALEDVEIKAIFENVSGYNAKRNEAILIVGIGMALRVSELVLKGGVFGVVVWKEELGLLGC